MRTETRTYTLYRITELSEEAKEKAHSEWLCNRYFYGWTHENRQTLDTFCERFGIVCRNWRYDACNYSYDYRSRQEDCIDGLNGWRLAAYLMNNHWNDLYTPKYFWKGTKGRKSRIFVDACCPLTGYYIDNRILDPIYQFLKSPTENITFDSLMNECLDSFFRACRDDMESTRIWNTSRKKATPTVGNTFQTENHSINYQHLKLIIMKTNKKVQTNSVQKSEKENAVKVTALAIIPKPITLLTPQDVPTATEVTEAPETATVPTVTEEAPQQATFKTPLATATAETDLDITTIHPSTDNHRKTFNDASLQELAESIREVGILQAIAVRPRTEGGYEIIYGERRYRASLLAGAKTIKATIYNNVTDDEAEDMSLSENLQREQVRPTEEAKAFKRLLEKGRYDMYSLTVRFGRSEKYIYTRLKLNELYAPIGELLDNETITVSVAEEISTYEPDIQKDVYEKHLKEGNGEDWTGYTLNLFKRYFEKYYTTDLGQYKFDRTECKTCVHNAANYNLFAEHNGCGHCTNRKCLEAKNAAHVAKETEKLLKSDPKLVVARPYYGSRNDMALQKLDKKGHEIKELDYNVSAREFPKVPEAPKKEQFTQTKEYEQAVQTFERRNEEYARKVEELDRMKEEGRIKTYVKVGQTEPELCYVEINRKETAPVTIGTLQERDKRFKQLSIEKTVADTKKIVRENDYPESPFTQYEDGMVYFAMLAQLQRKHFPLFGIKDQPFALDEKQRMKIVAKLTDTQKTAIKRDFISHFLCENGHGDNNASKLLRDFANMHFPDQYGLAKATHEEEYQKRHERLEERIKEMKKAEKKAAKETEKQQTAEKKTTAPKTEKPESGKAA